MLIERSTLQIIDVQEAKGSEHDFTVYKGTIGKGISNSIPLDAGLGYLGIEAYHPNSFIPIKSSKNHQLSEEEKGYNKELAERHVMIEHIKNMPEYVISLPGTLPKSAFSENDFDLWNHKL